MGSALRIAPKIPEMYCHKNIVEELKLIGYKINWHCKITDLPTGWTFVDEGVGRIYIYDANNIECGHSRHKSFMIINESNRICDNPY